MFEKLTVASMFVDSASLSESACSSLCADEESSVRFTNIRRVATRTTEFLHNVRFT